MTSLADVAPAFVEMAHQIVWCTVATVDTAGKPRTRVLHPVWEWDGTALVGWIATGNGSLKTKHVAREPRVSLTYWAPNQDTISIEADASMHVDDETRVMVWNRFKDAPAPVGYDPAMIPPWSGGPTSDAFAAMRLDPLAIRLVPQMDVSRMLAWKA
jgi:general stress protein 26